MSSEVIRSANYAQIESKWQINSRNLDQAFRFTTVFNSPLLTFLYGQSTSFFDSFPNLLAQDFRGELLNAEEKKDQTALKRFTSLKHEMEKPIGDYVKMVTDSVAPLVVVPTTTLAASTTDKIFNVAANAAQVLQRGINLFNPRTNEILIVDETPENNNNISVTRAGRGSSVGTVLTTDTLLVTGIPLGLYTPQTAASKPIPRRGAVRANGFRVLFTPGTPISNTFREETVLYDGRFLDFINDDLIRVHKSMLLNCVLYEQSGAITSDDLLAPLSNINRFNGWTYWAGLNPNTTGFQNIGQLDAVSFRALMSWFNAYEGVGKPNSPMVYICGPTAWSALQPFLKAEGGIVTKDDGFGPSTVGYTVEQYINEFGKKIIFVVDSYLQLINRGGDIFMCQDGNINFYIGKDEFFTPENPAIAPKGIMDGAARFCQFIENYSVKENQRTDLVISYFSMLPSYVELIAHASGIINAQ